jgi:predicted flap endonuclease-1-like 5' DNA nuclease
MTCLALLRSFSELSGTVRQFQKEDLTMALKLRSLKDVTPEIMATLKSARLDDSERLLTAASKPKARTELAKKLGIDARTLLEIANRADLGRIWGIGARYADLLEDAGVDTVIELRNRNPDNLFEKISQVAADLHVHRPPLREEVHNWVNQAKQLDRAIYY